MKALKGSNTSFGWEINCYNQCGHGCLYCFGRTIRRKKYEDWIKPTPRLQVVDWLKKDVKEISDNPHIRKQIKDILICGCTDGYQDLEFEHDITRNVIRILIDNELPFTVLTKNTNVLEDIAIFKAYKNCRVGFTIITLDEDFRELLEPNASPIEDRCEGLEILKEYGISTYCSVEPIMSDVRSDPLAIINKLRNYVDLFEFGKWNPYAKKEIEEQAGVVYSDDYYLKVFSELIPYCEKEGIKYCIAKHSEDFLKSHGFRFIPAQLVSDRPYPDTASGNYHRCVIEQPQSTENPTTSDMVYTEAEPIKIDDLTKIKHINPIKTRRIVLIKKKALKMFNEGKSPSDFKRIGGISKPTLNRYYREWKSYVSQEDKNGENQ